MNNEYFVVRTTDGMLYTFEKQCNQIDYSKNGMCVFYHQTDARTSSVLGVIPLVNISAILRTGDDGVE